MSAGMMMTKLAIRAGAQVAAYPEYPSLIQGGHNTYEFTAAFDSNPYSTNRLIDCLVCLNEDAFTLHKNRLTDESLVLYDPETKLEIDKGFAIPVPFGEIQAGLKADKIMINMVALGASCALIGISQDILNQLIISTFGGKKSGEVVEINTACAQAGFEYVMTYQKQYIRPFFSQGAHNEPEQLLMTGNDAFSLGAAAADCRYYAAYPMTPTSAVLAILAGWQTKTGMVVRHSEDEIAVINSALGASFSGVRAAVGTSGGGFALMVEAVSMAGIIETPIVILMGQRPGPATGMPTWTEQGDLLFTVHAGHGEFPKIVLAPGDLREMIELTIKAFDLADVYQTPVIILSDKFLGESHSSITKSSVDELIAATPNRGKLLEVWDSAQTYLRYDASVEDGISPRLIPGTPGAFYQANSYEHLEDTHTTESAAERLKQVDKRARKITTYLETDYSLPELYGPADAQITLVGWGSTKGPALGALDLLLASGVAASYLHFTHLYPLHETKVAAMFHPNNSYLLLENNSTGQFGQLLRQHTGISIGSQFLKYDGRPFFKEEVAARVITELQNMGNRHKKGAT